MHPVSIDRPAIATYASASAATRAFPLQRMTSHGKRTALQLINRLFYMGEADPAEGLIKALSIGMEEFLPVERGTEGKGRKEGKR